MLRISVKGCYFMYLNVNNKFLEAVQFYGNNNTGYDGEYSVRTKWLNSVISEAKDSVNVMVKRDTIGNTSVKIFPGDWLIYDPSVYSVIEICNNSEFIDKYSKYISIQ